MTRVRVGRARNTNIAVANEEHVKINSGCVVL